LVNYGAENLTFEQRELSLELMPESMCFMDGKLYVALLNWEHDHYRETEYQQGAFAVIDSATFTILRNVNINLDPYSI
jgi:hypothetical protein